MGAVRRRERYGVCTGGRDGRWLKAVREKFKGWPVTEDPGRRIHNGGVGVWRARRRGVCSCLGRGAAVSAITAAATDCWAVTSTTVDSTNLAPAIVTTMPTSRPSPTRSHTPTRAHFCGPSCASHVGGRPDSSEAASDILWPAIPAAIPQDRHALRRHGPEAKHLRLRLAPNSLCLHTCGSSSAHLAQVHVALDVCTGSFSTTKSGHNCRAPSGISNAARRRIWANYLMPSFCFFCHSHAAAPAARPDTARCALALGPALAHALQGAILYGPVFAYAREALVLLGLAQPPRKPAREQAYRCSDVVSRGRRAELRAPAQRLPLGEPV